MKSMFTTIKEDQKRMAAAIAAVRRLERYQKSMEFQMRNGVLEPVPVRNIAWNGDTLSRHFRHRHIAYSLLRGRTMEQIERTTHYPPDMELVEKYRQHFLEIIEREKNKAAA